MNRSFETNENLEKIKYGFPAWIYVLSVTYLPVETTWPIPIKQTGPNYENKQLKNPPKF